MDGSKAGQVKVEKIFDIKQPTFRFGVRIVKLASFREPLPASRLDVN